MSGIFRRKDPLSKAEDKSKSREKRLEEKEKVIAETQRSYAVAEM